MKAVLASLKPYFYYLVGEGIKGVEVRKNYPKAEDWSKDTYFYMSRDEKSFAKIPKEFQEKYRKHFGKVGLRFVCDRIGYVRNYGDAVDWYDCKASCLSAKEIIEYATDKNGNFVYTYGWHITDLVVYDEPRELGEFIVPSKIGCCNEGKCRGCKYLDRGNGFNVEDDCNAKFSTDEYKPLRRPPQSWCYVEVQG